MTVETSRPTETRAEGAPSLATLRGEAAALHRRAAQLERTCAAIERELADALKAPRGRDAAKARRLRGAIRETLHLLEETVRRRTAVRAEIAALEARVQREREEAGRTARTAEAPASVAPAAAPATTAPSLLAPAPPPVSPAEASPPAEPVPSPTPSTQQLPPAAGAPAPESPAPPFQPDVRAAPPVDRVSQPGVRREPSAPLGPPRIARQRLDRLRPERRGVSGLLHALLRPQAASGAVLSAILVMLVILLTPLPELFGWQLYAVETGSMEPAISVGSVVAVRPVPAEALRVGDVITFSDRTQPDVRVTHRIVALEQSGGQQTAVTKGDANNTTDSWSVPLGDNVARVELHVPYAGYVMYWLGSP
ncbi:MAG TPA: signal peptidase I, partial [Chloroflexota bacterium]|nr:signal peptidase I [Chloroflexota bacterium]